MTCDRAETVTLRDGHDIELRTIQPSDAPALNAFHEGLSPESNRLRFFGLHPHLTAAELERFTTVDHVGREAFVAIRKGEIIGVGRYDQCSPTAAEVAFVVADEWQAHGVATLLLEHLAACARTNGITTFAAETLGENAAMRQVFRHWAAGYKCSMDCGVVHVEMALPSAPAIG